jgi:hypothetical protein
MGYSGPERRVHKVFVTKNTEYHTCKNVCIGVKDRSSGQWVTKHKALTKSLCVAIRFTRGGMRPNTGAPRLGESLYFHGDDIDVVTSSLTNVERPAKDIVQAYPSVSAPRA